MSDEETFTHKRADFRERLSVLAGKTTYRVPNEGRSTAPLRMTDQDIAAALSYARRGWSDIGPDIAYSIVCQSDGYRIRIVRELAEALAASGGHALRRLRHHSLTIANDAYRVVVWSERVTPPEDASPAHYLNAVAAGASILATMADEAIHRAARAYRGA